jgi:hypothetical protein
MTSFRTFLVLLFICITSIGYTQSISGFVLDEQNNPIPFAKVFVKNYSNTGGITSIEGKYSFHLAEGNYELIYSSLGFESQTLNITIKGYFAVII